MIVLSDNINVNDWCWNVYAFVLPVIEVIILEVLLEPRLTQVDSGSLPTRGKAMLEPSASVSPISMNRMVRFSTDHCWKKENFCRVA